MFTTQVTPFVRPSVVCQCGSSFVAKRYVHDHFGEVVGQNLTCQTCANFLPGY